MSNMILFERIETVLKILDQEARDKCDFCCASNYAEKDKRGFWHRGYDKKSE